MRRWKLFYVKRNNQKVWVAIFISDKIDFKRKFIAKDKESYYIMIKVISTSSGHYTH